MQRRTTYFLIAAAATAVAAFALDAPQPAPPELLRHAPVAKQERSQLPAALPGRPLMSKPHGDVFAAWSWAPPATAPQPAVQVFTQPAPPPVPYRFVGHLTHDGTKQHFVMKGDVLVPVNEGETLDGVYRVEALTADEITLLYVPLGLRTRLALASPPETGPSAAQASAPAANILPSASQPLASQGPESGSTGTPRLRAAQLRGPRTQTGLITQ